MVSVRHLSKTFRDPKRGEILAVRDVSFEAHPGKVLGLLGVNGAGKTTTLRMLSTVLSPGAGSATVNGFDLATQPTEIRKSIGFVSGTTALYGRLSAKECLDYFGRLYGIPESELKDKVNQVVNRLRITEYVDQLCDKLSTGQKQRVSIARAILHDPPVLFFDEPTAGLDVLSSQSIMEFIEDCRAAGKTVIFSTHIMSEVERLCDEVVVIHHGQVLAAATASDLKTQTGQATLEQAFLKIVGYEKETLSA